MGNKTPTENEMNAKPPENTGFNAQWVKWFAGVILVCALIMAFRALALMSDSNTVAYRLSAAGWGKLAEAIVQNRISALWHAALMTVCAGIFIWLFCQRRWRNQFVRQTAEWLLVIIMVADAFMLSRHYIKTMPMKAFEENDVVRILKSDQLERRVVLAAQDSFYNHWLTFLFPYHGIKTINVTQMPRMPSDYRKFFEAVAQNPLRFWQLSAVGFVLAPALAWGQFQNDPVMKGAFDLVYAYNVKSDGSYVQVVPATAEQPGQHVIMRLLKPAPRFALIGPWEVVGDAEALRRLSATNYPLFEKVMIAPENRNDLPDSGGSTEDGRVQVLAYQSGKVWLRTSSTGPSVLRVAERYHPDWKVWIDGKKGRVLRADFIFQAVLLESGMHEVFLEYAPSKTLLWVQAAGFFIFAAAAVALLCRRKRGGGENIS